MVHLQIIQIIQNTVSYYYSTLPCPLLGQVVLKVDHTLWVYDITYAKDFITHKNAYDEFGTLYNNSTDPNKISWIAVIVDTNTNKHHSILCGGRIIKTTFDKATDNIVSGGLIQSSGNVTNGSNKQLTQQERWNRVMGRG